MFFKGVDPLKTEIGSVQDLGSSRASSVWHSLSPDVAYDEENLSKVDISKNRHLKHCRPTCAPDSMFCLTLCGLVLKLV